MSQALKVEEVEWSIDEDAELVHVLEEQKRLGNQSETGWKNTVWSQAANAIAVSFPDAKIKKEAKHCKSRWQRLKGLYKIVKGLRDVSGFGWDDATQMVQAADEVWDRYLESHADARTWRYKPFPLHDMIATLVDDVLASGAGVFHATVGVAGKLPDSIDRHGLQSATDNQKDQGNLEPIPVIGHKRSHDELGATPSTPTTSRYQKQKASQADLYAKVSSALESLTSAFQASSTSTAAALLSTPQRKARALNLALKEEANMSEPELMSVASLFERSIEAADMYLVIEDKQFRRRWLDGKIGMSSNKL